MAKIKALKFADFKDDLNHFIISGATENPDFIYQHIDEHYSHIKDKCVEYVKSRQKDLTDWPLHNFNVRGNPKS